MVLCVICLKSTTNPKFCSRSCAAKYNNKNRIKSEESKKKTSKSILTYREQNPQALEQSRKNGLNQRGKRWAKKPNPNWTAYKEAAKFYTPCYILEQIPNYHLVYQIGWYHPKKNTNGASRDHMYSVKDGWDHNVPIEIIKHPANCQIMTILENKRKGKKSSISLDKLYQLIELWEDGIRDRD